MISWDGFQRYVVDMEISDRFATRGRLGIVNGLAACEDDRVDACSSRACRAARTPTSSMMTATILREK